MYNIAVVGGGVIGITSALILQDELKKSANITVYTEKLSPYTTGDVSAGLWGPFLLQETNMDDIMKWSKATQDYFMDLWRNGYADEAGICLEFVTRISQDSKSEYPEWLRVPFGSQLMSTEQLEKLNKQYKKKYEMGYTYVCLTFEPTKFLPFFQNKFIANGGRIKMQKITDLQQLSDYDVVINCAGLYAKELAKDDKMTPIRGQVTRVRAPWQFQTIMDDENYVITNHNTIVLGGTAQMGDYDTNPRHSDMKMIMEGCTDLLPALKNAEIIQHTVGLRPGRTEVRLELEVKKINGKNLKIVHNYGHGGSGVTLCYGCALTVKDLVKEALNIPVKSKL